MGNTNENKAMKRLAEIGKKYGLEMAADKCDFSDVMGRDSFFNYIIRRRYEADYERRRAVTNVFVTITIRRIGGDGMTPQELERMQVMAANARQFLEALNATPIEYVVTW